MQITALLHQLIAGSDLSAEQMQELMHAILAGKLNDVQLSAVLVALRCKGESVTEIASAAQVLRSLAQAINITGTHLIDTCGTGGDGANTFNISTTCAFVVAAAGGKVAKHGNRSVSSRCGSADVLEAAGVNLQLSAEQVAQCVNTLGVGFLFAPNYHPALRHVSLVRKTLGLRTVFNLLGPLVNPANAPNQLLGVFSQSWVEPLAQVLHTLGSQHVLVVCAEDGLDEISIAAPTLVAELHAGEINTYSITPEQFGLPRAPLTALAAKDVLHSLQRLYAVLDNQSGPALNIVLLNAGAAIYAANLTPSLAEGIAAARQAIASGAARAKLDALVAYSQTV